MASFLVVRIPKGHDSSTFLDVVTNKGLVYSVCHKTDDFTKFLGENNASESTPKKAIEDSVTVKIEEGASIDLADLRVPGTANHDEDSGFDLDGEIEDSEKLVIRGGKVTYEGGDEASFSGSTIAQEESSASINESRNGEEYDLDLGCVKASILAFECPECQKVLTTKHGLDIHRRTHTGEKPFSCWDCRTFLSD